jgi:hypothetical protein
VTTLQALRVTTQVLGSGCASLTAHVSEVCCAALPANKLIAAAWLLPVFQ